MSQEEFASQWAILPARVRYDAELPPNAKLLFAEIAAKTNTLGYCWAYNSYFAETLTLSEDRVGALIRTLEERGYIVVDYDASRDNAERRRIYLTDVAFSFRGTGKNADTPLRKCRDGTGENAGTLKENNKEKIGLERPKYMAVDIFKAICHWCGEDGELLLAWMQYADMRQRKHKPVLSVATVERACKKIDTLSKGERSYRIGLLHKATDRCWLGFYALEDGDEGFSTAPVHEPKAEGRKDLMLL